MSRCNPFADHVFGLVVLFEGSQEAVRLALGTIEPSLREASGPVHQLGGFTLGSRNDVVPVALGLVDELFSVFLGIRDIFERGSDCFRRIDVLELHGGNLYASMVLIENRLQQRQGILLNHCFSRGQGFVDLTLSDNFTHRGFGRFPDGFMDVRDVE